jgi:tRNA-dihydrouridine synthase C
MSMKPILPKNKAGCPTLLLAPMEGLGDRTFRKAMASIGGFDQACTEFIRVPLQAHIPSLSKKYDPLDTFPISQAAQLMGSDPVLMAEMAVAIEAKGAPRIDLNCGCPSNTVTGRGAGSSLLKDPKHLHKVAKSMVDAVNIPVTAKLRSGFEDISLFKENILAAQESGISFMTLHPRTKVDGYGPPARWDLIAEAKSLLTIPLVGNGDILNVDDALRMLKQTSCDALMIGRGAAANPFIFHQIKAHFAGESYDPQWEQMEEFFRVFMEGLVDLAPRSQINKLKQIFGCLFKANRWLTEQRQVMLTASCEDGASFLNHCLPIYKAGWKNMDGQE